MNVPAKKQMRGRPSGGIGLAVSQSIRKNYTMIYNYDQVTAIFFKRPKLAVLVSYFQPNFENEELIREVADALSNANPDYHIVLLGDFNCRIDIPNEKQESLYDPVWGNNFICWKISEMLIYIPHNGKSPIDLHFTKKTDSLAECELIDSPLPKNPQISGTITGFLPEKWNCAQGEVNVILYGSPTT